MTTEDTFCKTCTETTPSSECNRLLNEEIISVINHVRANASNHETALLFFAITQVGKSYLLNLILGENMKIVADEDGDLRIENDGIIDEQTIKIGTGQKSMTFLPNFRNINLGNEDLCLVDLPGFNDSQKINPHCYYNKRIISNFAINLCVKSFKNIKIAVLVDSNKIKDPNSDETWQLLDTVCDKFGCEDLEKRVALILTKNGKLTAERIPTLFTEYGKVMESAEIRSFLDKRSFCFLKKPSLCHLNNVDQTRLFFDGERKNATECIMRITQPSNFLNGKKFDLDSNTVLKVTNFILANIGQIEPVNEKVKHWVHKMPTERKEKLDCGSEACPYVILGAVLQNYFPIFIAYFSKDPNTEILKVDSQIDPEKVQNFGFAVMAQMKKFENRFQSRQEYDQFFALIIKNIRCINSLVQNYRPFLIIRDSLSMTSSEGKRIFATIENLIKSQLINLHSLQTKIKQKYDIQFFFYEQVLEYMQNLPPDVLTVPGMNITNAIVESLSKIMDMARMYRDFTQLTGIDIQQFYPNRPINIWVKAGVFAVGTICCFVGYYSEYKDKKQKYLEFCNELNEMFDVFAKSAEKIFSSEKVSEMKNDVILLKSQIYLE